MKIYRNINSLLRMIILENKKGSIILNGDKCTKEFVEKIKNSKKWDGDVTVIFLDKKKEIKYLYKDNSLVLISSKLRNEISYDTEPSYYEDEFYECCDI